MRITVTPTATDRPAVEYHHVDITGTGDHVDIDVNGTVIDEFPPGTWQFISAVPDEENL